MVCICKTALSQLQMVLPQLDASSDDGSGSDIQQLAAWLAQSGLPAAPWQPDEAWLDLDLPTISLSVSAMATLSAFAQVSAGALALGIDLQVPAQATAFMRLAATLDARLDAMQADPVDSTAWAQLSATLTAITQVQSALQLGLLPAPPPAEPLAPWQPFLANLRPLLPMIAISAQLDTPADLAAELGVMVRAMLQISMPVISPDALSLMASLTASLSAIAQIGLSLNIDPLQVGLVAVQQMVSEQVLATTSAIEDAVDLSLPNLLDMLPQIQLDYCPTLMAPPAVVSAALSLNLPPITWQVPVVADLPVLSVGLPVIAFTAQLSAALGLTPTLSPCAVCDAVALVSALL